MNRVRSIMYGILVVSIPVIGLQADPDPASQGRGRGGGGGQARGQGGGPARVAGGGGRPMGGPARAPQQMRQAAPPSMITAPSVAAAPRVQREAVAAPTSIRRSPEVSQTIPAAPRALRPARAERIARRQRFSQQPETSVTAVPEASRAVARRGRRAADGRRPEAQAEIGRTGTDSRIAQVQNRAGRDSRFASARNQAIRDKRSVGRWRNDWSRFRRFHHLRSFNPGIFYDFAFFAPWFLFPLGYYNYWYDSYQPCWNMWNNVFRYPCYWDYGYAKEINLVTYAANNEYDEAIAKINERIDELEDQVAQIQDEQQRQQLEDEIKELQWYLQDIERLRTTESE